MIAFILGMIVGALVVVAILAGWLAIALAKVGDEL